MRRVFVTSLLVGMLGTVPFPLQGEGGRDLGLKEGVEPQLVPPLLASELPSQLDRYARTTRELETYSTRFQEHYQRFIRTLDTLGRAGKPVTATPGCMVPELVVAYASARDAFERYRLQARTVRNVQRRLEQYDLGGYTPGLTPDLQARMRSALEEYERIRKEHVNLQALLKNQVEAEIRRAGCNPEALNLPPAAPTPAPVAAKTDADPSKPEGKKAAKPEVPSRKLPGIEIAALPVPAGAGADGEDAEASGNDLTGEVLAPMEIQSDDRLLPGESFLTAQETPYPYSASMLELSDVPTPTSAPDAGPAKTPAPPPAPTPTPAPAPPIPEGLGVRFSVDNRQCTLPVQVWLDSRLLGTVTGEKTAEFSATEGRHLLCLGREGVNPCKSPSDFIRVILYEGFAVRPRC